MTNKEKDIIRNDDRFYKIVYSTPSGNTGTIYTKLSLIELKRKSIEKKFKGCLYYLYPCSYNEYFMHYVALLYRKMKRYIRWRCKRWNEIYFFNEDGHIEFKDRDEDELETAS